MRFTTLFVVALSIAQTSIAQTEPAPAENLLRFEPQQVEMSWSRDGWCLRTNQGVLKEFGRRNTEATEALRLIRDLGLTERGVIGNPTPVLEYWLVRGEAPTGTVRGHRVLSIDLETVKTETDGGQWCVRDRNRVLFNFGYNKMDAEQTLELIRKYRFGRLVVVGQGAPTMMVFLGDPREMSLPHRHTLAPLSLRPTSIQTTSLKPASDAKQDAAIRELSAIQSYATPSIPPLRDTTQINSGGGNPQMMVVPGVTDRISRVGFDWRQARLRYDADGWVLHVGSLILARFGADEQTARRAIQVLNHYRFNEICLVGAPNTVAHFFTVNGHLPRNEFFGVASVPVLTEKLKIEQIEGRQAIVQGTEPLLILGERPEDARQLLDWIERHKVDRLCRVTTRDGQGMLFFITR